MMVGAFATVRGGVRHCLHLLLLLCFPLVLPGGCRGPYGEGKVALQAMCKPADLPLVRMWCRGHPVDLGADTGTEFGLMLFADVAAKFGAPTEGADVVESSSLRLCSQRHLPPLEEACWLVCTAHDAQVQGLLGWPVLRYYVWHLHLARGEHSFAPAVPAEVRAEWDFIPLEQGTLHAVLHLPGLGACMLDTGAPHALYLPREQWRLWRQKYPQLPHLFYYGESPAAGGAFLCECTKVPQLELGRLVLPDALVCESFCPESEQIILGCAWLHHYELWMDGPGGKCYFRPINGGDQTALSPQAAGRGKLPVKVPTMPVREPRGTSTTSARLGSPARAAMPGR